MSKPVDSTINPAIHARQTALLYRNVGLGQVITVLASVPTAYLGYISRPGTIILLWLFSMVLTAYARFRLAQRYQAAKPSDVESINWSTSYIRLVIVQSVLWVVGCGSIMWGNTDSYRFLAVLILAGMVAGAVPILSTIRRAFRAFALPIVIGTMIIIFADASAPVHYVLGFTLIVFLGGVLRSADYFNEVLVESITVALEKSHLVRKAEAAARAKDAFLANISHEIRTPMNSMLGMAQLAFKGESDPQLREYLKKIQSSGEHLLGIIDDILDISKLDAGKLSIEVVDFELAKCIETLKNLIGTRAEDKHLKLSIEIDPAVPRYLRGDPLRLCQVLTNLVNNAIKFTEKGEVTVRVKRQGEGKDAQLYFEVQDTGVGMSRDEITMLFQPFQQTDSSTTRKYGGTGLGLYISKQLVDMMEDGKIGVESFPERGSTFWFTVRLVAGVQPSSSKSSETGNHDSNVLEKIKGAHILVVDDNVFNLEVAEDFLLGAGAVVSTCSNGKEALALLHLQHFDCVLMDVQMPVMDGIEAVQKMRAEPSLRDVRVIGLTANASKEDTERYLSAGMDDVIVKPFKYQMLFTTLARWLPSHSSGAASRAQSTAASQAQKDAAKTRPELKRDLQIIDLSVLADMVGSDYKKFIARARSFDESLDKDLAAIEDALARKDLAALGALGHHCKTPARMVGAMGYADLCQAMEDNAHGGDLERAQDIVAKLRQLLPQIKERIEAALSQTN
ncbi:MAG: ATP-binding protein [Sideroxydans sp.]|nr:ATP-binding protein [Sideroxydans sp.]